MDSGDELVSFFWLLSSQLSQSMDNVIHKMKRDEITVEDISHMNKTDLYDYGVEGFRDAKMILQHAKDPTLLRQRSGSQNISRAHSEDQPSRLQSTTQGSKDFEGHLTKKLIDIPPTLRDVFAAHLDSNVDGISCWEQFGEKLLQMDATDLRQFQSRDSPTKAILNKKIATDPSSTLEDAFTALEAIGRKDVTELVLQKIAQSRHHVTPPRQDSFERTTTPPSAISDSQRYPLVHQSSSTEIGHGSELHKSSSFSQPSIDDSYILTHHPSASQVDTSSHHTSGLPKYLSIDPSSRTSSFSKSSSQEDICLTSTEQSENTDQELCDFLRTITLDDTVQDIQVTCKVYNAVTNEVIKDSPPPLLRDIFITSRVQCFSEKSIPRGSEIRLEITIDSSCYLYILNIGTSGNVTMLLPNEYDRNNFFHANNTYYFPAPRYGFTIEGPPGKEVIQVMAFSERQDKLETYGRGSVCNKEPLMRDIRVLRSSSPGKMSVGYGQVEFNVT